MHKSFAMFSRLLDLGLLFNRRLKPSSLLLGSMLIVFAGCASNPPSAGVPTKVVPDVQMLNPGDVIKISFPGAQNLDTNQQIRRDGRINLYMIGEVKAADKTPAQLEKE